MNLPAITDDERELLHYNPNTDDVVEFVQNYAKKAAASLEADVLFFARMLDGVFDLERMSVEGNEEQRAAASMVRKYLSPNEMSDEREDQS